MNKSYVSLRPTQPSTLTRRELDMTSINIRLLRPEPYGGASIGIVIGIDVGTTFSGVSYSILRPGEIPEVLSVTRSVRCDLRLGRPLT